jgi:hypothetical protein
MQTITIDECWKAVNLVFEADLALVVIALIVGLLIGQYVYIPVPFGKGDQ